MKRFKTIWHYLTWPFHGRPKSQRPDMVKFGTKFYLYEIYYAEIGGVLYEAFINKDAIVLRANSSEVARFSDEDAFLRFEINGVSIGSMIEARRMKPAEFSTTPLPD